MAAPNNVYDPEREGQTHYEHPDFSPEDLDEHRNDPLDNKPAEGELPEDFPSLDNIRDQERGGGSSTQGRGSNGGATPDAGGLDGVRGGESSPENGGLFDEDGDEPQGRVGKAKRRLDNVRGRVRGMMNKPWFWGGVGVGGGGLVLVLIFLFIIAGALKLPTVMNSIENYEFASVTREFSHSAQNVTDEDLAVEATSDGVFSQLKDKFNTKVVDPAKGVYKDNLSDPVKNAYANVRATTWGRMDAYRPSQAIKTLRENNNFELHFRTTVSGRQVFTGATLDNVTYLAKPVTGIGKWVPGVNRVLETKNNADFIKGDFFPNLNQALKDNDVNVVIRGAVADQVLKESFGSRAGWALVDFKNLDNEDARIKVTQDMYESTEAGAGEASGIVTQEIADADAAYANSTKASVVSWRPSTKARPVSGVALPACNRGAKTSSLPEIVGCGGDSPGAEAAADAALSPSLLEKSIAVGNFTYAIATPLCIIYDGSVQHSKGPINNNTNRYQNTFNKLAAEAAQEENGDKTADDSGELNTAIQATSSQIGDITKSIPYSYSGGIPVSTANFASAEAGSSGGYYYSIFDALGGISPHSATGQTADFITSHMCSLLTSSYVAGGVALTNLGLALVTFGGSEAGEQAAGQGARTFATSFVKHIADNLLGEKTITDGAKTITLSKMDRFRRFVFKQGLIVGGTVGATELAHMVVAGSSGAASNGLAQGTDLVNEADAGANIEAGEIDRQQLFGRPLLCSEIGIMDKETDQQLSEENASKSFTQRYFATSNPNSLLTHAALSVNANANTGLLNAVLKLGASVLHPLSYFGSLFGMTSVAHAAINPCDQHYKNVQFGWSKAEEDKIDGNNSYKPLENSTIVTASGQENAIAQKYAICFGYSFDASGNGDLDPTDPNGDLKVDKNASLGALLSEGDIVRDGNGAVEDSGLCSKKNLSYENNEFGPGMVFRWRLEMRYDTTLDALINQQTVTKS